MAASTRFTSNADNSAAPASFTRGIVGSMSPPSPSRPERATPKAESTDAPVALVTGGAQRIGRAIALELAAAGWRVAVHYRHSSAEAAALVEELGALPTGVHGERGPSRAFGADLADEIQCRALV